MNKALFIVVIAVAAIVAYRCLNRPTYNVTLPVATQIAAGYPGELHHDQP